MSARDTATRSLAQQAARFPRLRVEATDLTALPPRDAALARAIEQAAVRRWLTLRTVLEHCLSRPWASLEPSLQGVLLAGAAQLLLLDRQADHAVVNDAVSWAKSEIRPRAGGLVNAVLRAVLGLRGDGADHAEDDDHGWPRDGLPLHDGRVRRLAEPIFDAEALPRLAAQSSVPAWLVRRWSDAFGWATAQRLCRHGLMTAPLIVTGLDHDEPECTPHQVAGFFVHDGPTPLGTLLGRHRAARVQDPGAAGAVAATVAARPRLIADVCAGRGTKTLQLAALHPEADLIAGDPNAARRADLRRATAGNPHVTVYDGSPPIGQRAGTVDLLVLDVPCSNSGVLGRRIEARYRVDDESISDLVDLQRQIIADSIALLGPEGWVLYSTCSLEPEENRQQAAWLARWHRMEIHAEHVTLPAGVPGDEATMYHDGGYWALLRRRGA